MKRNLISVPQQRSRSTFLKCRAPYAAARSLAADERSPPRGPPTAASPALWGAAPPPAAPPPPPHTHHPHTQPTNKPDPSTRYLPPPSPRPSLPSFKTPPARPLAAYN